VRIPASTGRALLLDGAEVEEVGHHLSPGGSARSPCDRYVGEPRRRRRRKATVGRRCGRCPWCRPL
jgi:hypothetical protein